MKEKTIYLASQITKIISSSLAITTICLFYLIKFLNFFKDNDLNLKPIYESKSLLDLFIARPSSVNDYIILSIFSLLSLIIIILALISLIKGLLALFKFDDFDEYMDDQVKLNGTSLADKNSCLNVMSKIITTLLLFVFLIVLSDFHSIFYQLGGSVDKNKSMFDMQYGVNDNTIILGVFLVLTLFTSYVSRYLYQNYIIEKTDKFVIVFGNEEHLKGYGTCRRSAILQLISIIFAVITFALLINLEVIKITSNQIIDGAISSTRTYYISTFNILKDTVRIYSFEKEITFNLIYATAQMFFSVIYIFLAFRFIKYAIIELSRLIIRAIYPNTYANLKFFESKLDVKSKVAKSNTSSSESVLIIILIIAICMSLGFLVAKNNSYNEELFLFFNISGINLKNLIIIISFMVVSIIFGIIGYVQTEKISKCYGADLSFKTKMLNVETFTQNTTKKKEEKEPVEEKIAFRSPIVGYVSNEKSKPNIVTKKELNKKLEIEKEQFKKEKFNNLDFVEVENKKVQDEPKQNVKVEAKNNDELERINRLIEEEKKLEKKNEALHGFDSDVEEVEIEDVKSESSIYDSLKSFDEIVEEEE